MRPALLIAFFVHTINAAQVFEQSYPLCPGLDISRHPVLLNNCSPGLSECIYENFDVQYSFCRFCLFSSRFYESNDCLCIQCGLKAIADICFEKYCSDGDEVDLLRNLLVGLSTGNENIVDLEMFTTLLPDDRGFEFAMDGGNGEYNRLVSSEKREIIGNMMENLKKGSVAIDRKGSKALDCSKSQFSERQIVQGHKRVEDNLETGIDKAEVQIQQMGDQSGLNHETGTMGVTKVTYNVNFIRASTSLIVHLKETANGVATSQIDKTASKVENDWHCKITTMATSGQTVKQKLSEVTTNNLQVKIKRMDYYSETLAQISGHAMFEVPDDHAPLMPSKVVWKKIHLNGSNMTHLSANSISKLNISSENNSAHSTSDIAQISNKSFESLSSISHVSKPILIYSVIAVLASSSMLIGFSFFTSAGEDQANEYGDGTYTYNFENNDMKLSDDEADVLSNRVSLIVPHSEEKSSRDFEEYHDTIYFEVD